MRFLDKLLGKKEIVEEKNVEEETKNKEVIEESKEVDNRRIIERPKVEELEKEKKPVIEINENYKLPTIDILDKPKKQDMDNQSNIENNIRLLEEALEEFNILGKVVAVYVGPAITQYELALKPGFRINKLMSISREIGLAMAKKDVRIIVPLPGKSTVGIEVANDNPATVYIKEIMERYPLDEKNSNNKLLIPLGKDLIGDVKFCDLNEIQHLIIAGETGSGKSIFIDSVLASILMRAKPNEVKLLLIDPKKVELSMYNGIPHLLTPVVTDPKRGSVALQKIVQEIEHRYNILEQSGNKNIETYNEMVEIKNNSLPEEQHINKMSYIVVIIDEIADLIMVSGQEVEDSIMRISQLARAAGVHLIIATQCLSHNVITELIKSSIPARIAFDVASVSESKAIIDIEGAEKLLGKGDMLYLPKKDIDPIRIQGAWICEDEIHRIIEYVCNQQKAIYDEQFENIDFDKTIDLGNKFEVDNNSDLMLPVSNQQYNEIVDFIVQTGKASASLLQRRFKLGYNCAARVIDILEERGIIGPAIGNSKPREVLVKYANDSEEML